MQFYDLKRIHNRNGMLAGFLRPKFVEQKKIMYIYLLVQCSMSRYAYIVVVIILIGLGISVFSRNRQANLHLQKKEKKYIFSLFTPHENGNLVFRVFNCHSHWYPAFAFDHHFVFQFSIYSFVQIAFIRITWPAQFFAIYHSLIRIAKKHNIFCSRFHRRRKKEKKVQIKLNLLLICCVLYHDHVDHEHHSHRSPIAMQLK